MYKTYRFQPLHTEKKNEKKIEQQVKKKIKILCNYIQIYNYAN